MMHSFCFEPLPSSSKMLKLLNLTQIVFHFDDFDDFEEFAVLFDICVLFTFLCFVSVSLCLRPSGGL